MHRSKVGMGERGPHSSDEDGMDPQEIISVGSTGGQLQGW